MVRSALEMLLFLIPSTFVGVTGPTGHGSRFLEPGTDRHGSPQTQQEGARSDGSQLQSAVPGAIARFHRRFKVSSGSGASVSMADTVGITSEESLRQAFGVRFWLPSSESPRRKKVGGVCNLEGVSDAGSGDDSGSRSDERNAAAS